MSISWSHACSQAVGWHYLPDEGETFSVHSLRVYVVRVISDFLLVRECFRLELSVEGDSFCWVMGNIICLNKELDCPKFKQQNVFIILLATFKLLNFLLLLMGRCARIILVY